MSWPTTLDTYSDGAQLPAATINAILAEIGIRGSAVTTALHYKLGGVTGSDKAASLTGTESLTNKTLGAGTKINLGTVANGDMYYVNGTGVLQRLTIGSTGQVLTVTGGVPAWGATSNDGWNSFGYTLTRNSADDPTYVLKVTGSDVTGILSVGMKLKFTQNSATVYCIITGVALSGSDTLITVYGGTDYDVGDTATLAITAPYYSLVKSPYGFPISPLKWRVEVENTTQSNQGSPTDGTWYNIGSISITIPIGSWHVSYQAIVEGRKSSTILRYVRTTLSTANNSESDVTFTSVLGQGGATGSQEASGLQAKSDIIDLTTKTVYYLNHAGSGSLTTLFINAASDVSAPSTILRAVCAYL